MSAMSERYDRSAKLFGWEGQEKLRKTRTVIAGVSGLGSPLAQQLALLGVGELVLIDPEELDDTNRNRFVGARRDDPVPGSPKVELVARLIREINPGVNVVPIQADLVSEESFSLVKAADWVFGCFDDDGPRFVLNELCAAYEIPYIDLASDVYTDGDGVFGGRICVSWDGQGCVTCLGELDMEDVSRYLSSDEEQRVIDEIYGVRPEELRESGPSVAPLNGVIAGHAAVEFMVAVTGLRNPARLTTYRGDRPRTTTSGKKTTQFCYFCEGIRGIGAAAEVERYMSMPHLRQRGRPAQRQ